MVAVGLMHSYLSHRDIINIPLQHKVPTQSWVEDAVSVLHPFQIQLHPSQNNPAPFNTKLHPIYTNLPYHNMASPLPTVLQLHKYGC